MEQQEPWVGEAKWIWMPDYDDSIAEARFFHFRKTFQLHGIPNEFRIHVSADTRYRLFVNGESVAFGPCKSYATRWYYETVDIAPLLVDGYNILTAIVLRFSCHFAGNSSMIRTAQPGFLIYGKSEVFTIQSDESWKVIEDKSIKITPRSEWNFVLGPPFLSLSETVDSSVGHDGWMDANYDDVEWAYAAVVIEKQKMMPMLASKRLTARTIPELPEIPRVFDNSLQCTGSVPLQAWKDFVSKGLPVNIGAGETVSVDFESSKLTTGFLQLKCIGTASIRILCSESYERPIEPGQSRYKGNRADFENGDLYGPDDYYYGKDGVNIYEPFWWRTFRYVRLTIAAEHDLIVTKFDYRETHYPLNVQTEVHTSTELNRMWEVSLNTLKNCMHETYEDCPYYEQNQFAMDARIQILFTYQISRDDRLARKCIQEFYASRREDGLVETHFPVPFRCINIPQFSLYWIMMIYDHMLYFGDMNLVKRYMGTIEGILHHFETRINKQGLVGRFDSEAWPFIDWVKEWHGTSGLQSMGIPRSYRESGVATYNSLVYAMTLNYAADLCQYIHRPDTAMEYRTRADKLNACVNKHCFNGLYMDGPGYNDYCQHSQIFAVLSGAITGKAAYDLMKRTLEDPMAKCSYSTSFYLLRAAAMVGIYEEKFDTLIEPWRIMLANNMTTWAEDDVMFRSDCHGWSSSPIYEIVSEIFGYKPCNRSLQIRPRPGIVKSARGTLITSNGNLWVCWYDNQLLVLKAACNMEIEVTWNGKCERYNLVADQEQEII